MPFDSTPQVTPALALLRAARAKIEDPRKWVKHDPAQWELASGLHCVVSSLGHDGWSLKVYHTLDMLAQSLPPGRWGRHVHQFSDAPETTHADILALFDRAERRLMERGA